MEQIKIKLNKRQMMAVDAKEDKVLIIAPAGSGKTSTLIGAIQRYKLDNPDHVVMAITFTNKATDELTRRLGPMKEVYASTIHSWAYQELERLSLLLKAEDPNNTFRIRLLQEDRIREILTELLRKRGYGYVNVGVLYSYAMGNYNMDISDSLRQTFQTILKDYIEYKRVYGLYDFTDLPNYLLDKLNDYGKDIDHIDALFVDEFQDVDDIQLELFNRVHAKKKFYIGDPKQSIYLFRGATEEVMERLVGFTKYDLDMNYRSYQEIMDFATTFQETALETPYAISRQLESYRSPVKCSRGEGGDVSVLSANGSVYAVNEFIKERGIDAVERMLQLNPMILCRKNKEVRAIRALGYDRVQTIHQAKGLEYPAVIVTDFRILGIEDINIAYVALTRAESHLMAAEYNALIKILSLLGRQGKLRGFGDLF